MESLCLLTITCVALGLSGCASTKSGSSSTSSTPKPAPAARTANVSASSGSPGVVASKYKTTDRRNIEIGKATPADGGLRFKNPHLDKCWLADGFNFSGGYSLQVAPVQSTAKCKPDEERLHEMAKDNLQSELVAALKAQHIFSNVIAGEAGRQSGTKVLKMENTVLEYSKGGGAARYFAGIYGAGQPMLRIRGTITENGKPVFEYEARRSGVSGNARLHGGFMKDEDIQIEDIRSFVLDLTDFIAAMAGNYTARR
jgi:hypothetical protein